MIPSRTVQQGDLGSTRCCVLAVKFEPNTRFVSRICIECFINGSEPLHHETVSPLQAWNGEIDHDPVKHGPTRGPRFDALLRTGRQIRTQYTVCFTNLYRMLHQWLGTTSS